MHHHGTVRGQLRRLKLRGIAPEKSRYIARLETKRLTRLIFALSEAAELEHTLMCTYLYAAFSLKNGEADGLSAREAEVVALTKALGRVGERNIAEIGRVVTDYFHARDALEPVSRDDLIARLHDDLVTVLDVRPGDEFALGHLPGALNIPLAELERRLGELPKGREVIAYCRGPWCVLSFEAVAALRTRGYRVRRLEDGYPEWKAAGLPVESAA